MVFSGTGITPCLLAIKIIGIAQHTFNCISLQKVRPLKAGCHYEKNAANSAQNYSAQSVAGAKGKTPVFTKNPSKTFVQETPIVCMLRMEQLRRLRTVFRIKFLSSYPQHYSELKDDLDFKLYIK